MIAFFISVYERNIFTIKDSRFKSDSFLDEVKLSCTDLINIYVRDDEEKQNAAIYQRERQLAGVEKEIAGTKGIFKGKQRKQQKVKERENNRESHCYRNDRGGR